VSKVPYIYQSIVYAGTLEVTEKAEFFLPKTYDDVVDLLEKVRWERLEGSHLTTDNFYRIRIHFTSRGRGAFSSEVWFAEYDQGRTFLASYIVNTKSSEKKTASFAGTCRTLRSRCPLTCIYIRLVDVRDLTAVIQLTTK